MGRVQAACADSFPCLESDGSPVPGGTSVLQQSRCRNPVQRARLPLQDISHSTSKVKVCSSHSLAATRPRTRQSYSLIHTQEETFSLPRRFSGATCAVPKKIQSAEMIAAGGAPLSSILLCRVLSASDYRLPRAKNLTSCPRCGERETVYDGKAAAFHGRIDTSVLPKYGTLDRRYPQHEWNTSCTVTCATTLHPCSLEIVARVRSKGATLSAHTECFNKTCNACFSWRSATWKSVPACGVAGLVSKLVTFVPECPGTRLQRFFLADGLTSP